MDALTFTVKWPVLCQVPVTLRELLFRDCPQPPGRADPRLRWGAARPENQRLSLAAWATLAPRGDKSVDLPRPRPHESGGSGCGRFA